MRTNYSCAIFCTSLRITYHSSMVRYVILRRNLRDVPPHISFRPARLSAWLFAKGGHLHSVQTPAPATWSTPSTEFPVTVSLLSYPDATVSMSVVLTDDEGSLMEDWPEADGNDGDYSPEELPLRPAWHSCSRYPT